MYDSTETWDLLSKKYSWHCITYELKRKKGKTIVVLKHTFHTHALMSRVQPVNTLFETYFLFIVNLLTVFSFSMLMPIDTCAIKKKLSKNGYHFALREDKPSSSSLVSHSSQLSHSLRAFALPLFHETSTQSSRKYYPRENRRVPKITLEGLQWVEGRPIWGIHSLSFILSWLPFWIAKPLFFPPAIITPHDS